MSLEPAEGLFYALVPFFQDSEFSPSRIHFTTREGSFQATNEGDTVFITCDYVPQLREIRVSLDVFLTTVDVIQALLLQAHDNILRIDPDFVYPDDFIIKAASNGKR